MTYSQKYCLVHFINPINVGYEFDMLEWPLHITVMDVFAVDRHKNDIDKKLATLFENYPTASTTALSDSVLGTTPVVLLDKTPDLIKLHNDIVSVLEENGAVFNTPAFTRDGFVPHSTVQNAERVETGNRISIDSVSLIDMFVDGDWKKRKVLATFKSQS